MINSAAWRYRRLNDPFCSKRGSNAAAKIVNAFEQPRQDSKIAASPGEICILT